MKEMGVKKNQLWFVSSSLNVLEEIMHSIGCVGVVKDDTNIDGKR